MRVELTIWRYIDVTLACDEVIALTLGLVLRSELSSTNPGHRLPVVRNLSLSGVVSIH